MSTFKRFYKFDFFRKLFKAAQNGSYLPEGVNANIPTVYVFSSNKGKERNVITLRLEKNHML